MKSERYFKKILIKKIGKKCIYSGLLILGLTFTMGFYSEPTINTKLTEITVELGNSLPDEITNSKNLLDYNSNLDIETNVPLDSEGNTDKVGKYSYYLVYKDESQKYSRPTNVKSTITVVDTVKPIIKLKENIEIDYEGEITPGDLAECFDLSDCKMYVEEDIDTTISGKHEVTIVAIDSSKNKTTEKTSFTVREKPVPVVQYTYVPVYTGGYQDIDNHNNAVNANLTEEEKNNLRYQIAEFAKQFIGNPYVYGGTSLTNGADCSGFTMSIYANYGYVLPRSAIDQAYVGTYVDAANLLPGDLVVYMHGHVGIYVGGGMMVHASTPEGGIKYAPMYEGYRVYKRIIN